MAQQQTSYTFKDRAEASFFYGEHAALRVYELIDTNRAFVVIAPVVCVDGRICANAREAIRVSRDELEAL